MWAEVSSLTQVADQFYGVLHKYCKKVQVSLVRLVLFFPPVNFVSEFTRIHVVLQAISCDEAYLDVTGVEDPEVLGSNIRKEIVDLTRCTASVGIAGNLLLARMATRKAKPDGQYKLVSEHVMINYMSLVNLYLFDILHFTAPESCCVMFEWLM